MIPLLSKPLARVGTIALLLFFALPLVWMIMTSLKSSQQLADDPGGLIFRPTLAAYQLAVTPELWHSMGVSLVVAASTAILTLILGIPAAFALTRVPGVIANSVLAMVLVLQMVPSAVSLVPLYRVLGLFELINTLPGLIFAEVAQFLPFAIILLRPFCLGIPRELIDAAAIDGAGTFTLLIKVILPLLRNGAAMVGALTFIFGWGEFLYAITFINDAGLQPLSALLAKQITAYGVNWPALMALSAIAAFPLFIIYLLVQRQFRTGLTLGTGK